MALCIVTIKTPFGLSSPVHFYETENFRFAYLSRHGEKGYEISAPFVNYRANIWALKEIGVERIIAWTKFSIYKFKWGTIAGKPAKLPGISVSIFVSMKSSV